MEEEKIKALALTAIADIPELFLVDVKIKGNTGNQKVLIFIDGDNGISIDQCSKVSRAVGAEIEELELIDGKYTLEVSSPGLDFPITLHRQYVKNVGRGLMVETNDGEQIMGDLKSVDEEKITLSSKKEERQISIKEIKQSKVIVSFK